MSKNWPKIVFYGQFRLRLEFGGNCLFWKLCGQYGSKKAILLLLLYSLKNITQLQPQKFYKKIISPKNKFTWHCQFEKINDDHWAKIPSCSIIPYMQPQTFCLETILGFGPLLPLLAFNLSYWDKSSGMDPNVYPISQSILEQVFT